jgi:hypothetical protein
MWLLSDLLKMVITRKSLVDQRIKPEEEIKISGADISARDNVAHSIAAVNIMNALERSKDMGLISDRELLRVLYRFAGESADLDELLKGGSGVDRRESVNPIQPVTKEPVDTSTGTPKKTVMQ